MDDIDDEKIPPLNLANVIRWRTKIGEVLNTMLGRTMVSPDLEITAARITSKLRKLKKLPKEIDLDKSDPVYAAVHRTLADHALGQVLDYTTISSLKGLLAGNITSLQAGLAVPLWVYQPRPEWVLAIVRDAYGHVTPHKQIHGTQLVLEVLTGPATNKTVQTFFTDASLNRLGIRIGAKRKSERRTLHPRNFVRLYVLLKLAEGPELKTLRYKEKASLAQRNLKRSDARRDYKKTCPKHLKWPCAFCKYGYVSCPQGTHASDYRLLPCRGGHMGYIDHEYPHRQCTHCNYIQWIRKTGGSYERDDGDAARRAGASASTPVGIPPAGRNGSNENASQPGHGTDTVGHTPVPEGQAEVRT